MKNERTAEAGLTGRPTPIETTGASTICSSGRNRSPGHPAGRRPGRAEFIGSFLLRDVEVAREHRGLVTVTGTSSTTGGRATVISPLRTTVATSGMGTPSLEIVLNELVALNEIDFATRRRRPPSPHARHPGRDLRALQSSTPLGTPSSPPTPSAWTTRGFSTKRPA